MRKRFEPPSLATLHQVRQGLLALEAGDWVGARDMFTTILDVAGLPEAFSGLAIARFWTGDLAGMVDAYANAYRALDARGDRALAAGTAMSLVHYTQACLHDTTAARGWLSRMDRDTDPAWVFLRAPLIDAAAVVADDPIESQTLARRAIELARAEDEWALELSATHTLGRALVRQGRTQEGIALLEEVMPRVIRGEDGDPQTIPWTSCLVLQAAETVTDALLRAGQPATAVTILRCWLDAAGPDRRDLAAVTELLGQAEIAATDTGTAAGRGQTLVAAGTANDHRLAVAHGQRLIGRALASAGDPAARGHLDTALAAFEAAKIPYQADQTRLLLRDM